MKASTQKPASFSHPQFESQTAWANALEAILPSTHASADVASVVPCKALMLTTKKKRVMILITDGWFIVRD
jgi:hypothetical protein